MGKGNDSFVVVYDWMYKELGVSKANIYAMLCGLADDTGEAYCSVKYIANRLHVSTKQITRILNDLENSKYIERISHGTRNSYIVKKSPIQGNDKRDKMSHSTETNRTKCPTLGDKMSHSNRTKCLMLGDKMSHIPYVDNKEIIKSDNKAITSARVKSAQRAAGLESAIQDFIDFRKNIGKPMTGRAVDLLRKELDSKADSDAEKVQMLNQSILHGWTGIYPIDKRGAAANQAPKKTNTGFAPSYNLEELKKSIRNNTDIF